MDKWEVQFAFEILSGTTIAEQIFEMKIYLY